MKRKGIIVLALVIAAIGAYFLFFHKSEEKAAEAQKPLAISKNTGEFNTAFTNMLAVYDSLHDAFVNWDTVKATTTANHLKQLLADFPVKDIKADTTIIQTAKSFSDAAAAEAEAIAGESSIEGKRRSFYTLSENLYNLAVTVRYDQQVIYHMNCPMAFNDSEEAFWISNKNEVVNPYLGNKHPKYKEGMINCGEMKDSIDFRAK
jgi:hypothetical protein